MPVVHVSDPVMLYNLTRRKFLSNAQVKVQRDASGLSAFPTLVDDATEAGLMVVAQPTRAGAPLHTHEPITLRTVTGQVGARVFLGVRALTASSQVDDGALVTFLEPSDAHQVEWTVVDANQSDPQPVQYGQPYVLQHRNSEQTLTVARDGSRLAVVPHYSMEPSLSTDSTHDQWVFLPTFPVYVCQQGTQQCVSTRGKDNAFNPLRCMGDVCQNQFGERMFFDPRTCQEQCSAMGTPGTNVAALGSASPTATTPTSTVSAEASLHIAVAVTAAVLVVALLGVVATRTFSRR